MKENNNNTDKIVRDLLFGFESDPPLDAWDNIANGLQRKQKKSFILFYKLAASIAFLLMVAGSAYYFSHFTESTVVENKTDLSSKSYDLTDRSLKAGKDIIIESKKIDESLISGLTDKGKRLPETSNNKNQIIPSEVKQTKSPDNDNFTDITEIEGSYLKHISSTVITSIGLAEIVVVEMVLRDDLSLYIIPSNSLSEHDKSIIDLNRINSDKLNNAPVWTFAGELSPVYSYRNLIHNDFDPVYEWGGGDFNELNEQPIIAFSGGVNMEYNYNRFCFTSGVYYSQIGQKTNDISINRIFNYNTNPGLYSSTSISHMVIQEPADGQLSGINLDDDGNYSPNILESEPVSTGASLTENFDFIEFPFVAKYILIDKKADLKVLAGFSTSFLVNNTTTVSYLGQEHELEKYNNLRTINYNSIIGLGFKYPFNSTLSFSLQPVFKYALNPLNKDYSVEYYPYSFAVYTGFTFDF